MIKYEQAQRIAYVTHPTPLCPPSVCFPPLSPSLPPAICLALSLLFPPCPRTPFALQLFHFEWVPVSCSSPCFQAGPSPGLYVAGRGLWCWFERSAGMLCQCRKAEDRGFLLLCVPQECLPAILLGGAAGGKWKRAFKPG